MVQSSLEKGQNNITDEERRGSGKAERVSVRHGYPLCQMAQGPRSDPELFAKKYFEMMQYFVLCNA
jgi:hypothetical protein